MPEAKKKRRIKKSLADGQDIRAYAEAKIAAETKAAAAAPPEPPARRAKLTMKDRQHYDYIREATMKNVWCEYCDTSLLVCTTLRLLTSAPCGARYYRDRLSTPRGPCNVAVLRECWVHGVIDEHTLVWGQGLGDWLPVRNIRTLVPQIRTFEGAARTCLHTGPPPLHLRSNSDTAICS